MGPRTIRGVGDGNDAPAAQVADGGGTDIASGLYAAENREGVPRWKPRTATPAKDGPRWIS
jgi:hypothetical protein